MVFGFSPEYCSASLRNSVRLRRNPQLRRRSAPAFDSTVYGWCTNSGLSYPLCLCWRSRNLQPTDSTLLTLIVVRIHAGEPNSKHVNSPTPGVNGSSGLRRFGSNAGKPLFSKGMYDTRPSSPFSVPGLGPRAPSATVTVLTYAPVVNSRQPWRVSAGVLSGTDLNELLSKGGRR